MEKMAKELPNQALTIQQNPQSSSFKSQMEKKEAASFKPTNSSEYKSNNNLCQQIIPRDYIYQSLEGVMTDKIIQPRKILIPNILHHQTVDRFHKEMEQTKTYYDSKFFISPNRESRPLGLPPSRGFSDGSYDQRFQPSFDNFSLSSMFANKTLSEMELAQFKKDKNNGSQIFETPARKKNESISGRETEEAARIIQSQAKKSRPKQKGLRQLSQRAYEIVLNLRSASYKEVANKLVDQLNNEKQLDRHILRGRIEEKDEQNIKRRVYDALNVLIALGVLRKEGRKIVGDRSIKLKFQQSDRKNLQEQIENKILEIARKKEILRKQQTKAKFLPMLISENMAKAQECNKISFPFMVVNASPKEIVKTDLNEVGQCQGIEIRKLININDLMKMDLDCYADYKMQLESSKEA